MRLVALVAAGAIVAVSTSGVEAADFAYPPASVGPPEYGVAAPPAVAPPQVLVVPGAPDVLPRYNAAPVPPAVVRPSPYGEAPPVAPPGVAPGPSPTPRAACGPVWRCGSNGCGWDSSCAPYPEPYAYPHRSSGPPVYSPGPPAPQPYAGPNGVPGSRVYSGPNTYSGPPGQMRWIIGPQPYGM